MPYSIRNISGTAILDRFLHHATFLTLAGRGYRLRNQSPEADRKASCILVRQAGVLVVSARIDLVDGTQTYLEALLVPCNLERS
jgi:hypothetical protein